MHRVLKRDGRLATTVWEMPKPDNGFGVLYGAINAHGRLDVPLPHGPNFFQFSEPDVFAAALSSTGFRDVTVEHIQQTWEMQEPLGIVSAIMEGAVRARGLLNLQSDAERAEIYSAVGEAMESFRSEDGGYAVPMPAWVDAGAR